MFRCLRGLVLVAVSAVAQLMAGQSVKSVKTPDFAYPRKVSEQAEKSLGAAVAAGDDQAVVRSLLDYTLARIAVGEENAQQCIGLIDSVMSVSHSRVLGGMLSTLEAVVYNNVYEADRWVYDRRNSPLLPLPDDCKEWSGEQFRYKIGSLIDAAIADSVALRAVSIGDFRNVVTQDRMTAVYYPTLYNFVVHQSVSILEGWGDGSHVFPLWMVRASADSMSLFAQPSLSRDPGGERILAAYGSVIAGAARGSAEEVNARLGRLSFLKRHSVEEDAVSRRPLDRDLYIELYKSYLADGGKPSTEYAGDILLAIPEYGGEPDTELYDTVTSFLETFPAYWRSDCLKQSLNQMDRKQVMMHAPRVTAPGREAAFTVSMRNVDKLRIDIYDVSSAEASCDEFAFVSGAASARKVASVPVTAGAERKPYEVTRKAVYTFEHAGNYIAVPVVDGVKSSKENYQKIHVTTVALGATSFLDRDIWAVDANDGSPLQDVCISINKSPYKRGSRSEIVGMTDADGALRLKDEMNGVVTATRGRDGYAQPLHVYDYNYNRPDKWVMSAHGYSSLPLYHQGDTVEWTAVCYEYKGGLNRPYSGKSVTAVLYDAGSVAVDTLECVTDRFGRAAGMFAIPEGGLMGMYQIAVDENWGVVRFDVSDYKLPTFRVDVPKVERDAPGAGDVTLRGKAETFAGFPLANADVAMSLSVMRRPRWWYPSRSYDVCSMKAVTDADGEYEVVIPADVFASSMIPQGYYTASVSVLSGTGETQTSVVSFARGERYVIKATMPGSVDLTNGILSVESRVVNYEDSTVAGPVDVRLLRGDSAVVYSSVIEGKADIDVKGFGQGAYGLVLARENADTVKREVILYDPCSTDSPVTGQLLWSPEYSMSVNSDGEGAWLYAVDCDTHLLVTIWTADSVISRRWVPAHKGFNRLDVSIPDGVDEATINIMATGNYRQDCENVTVKRSGSEEGLLFEAETFRDRTVPGEEESWTFRVTDLAGDGREAAVIAGMYNTALDALAKQDWSFKPRKGSSRWLNCYLSSLTGISESYMRMPVKSSVAIKCPELVEPDFNTYGQPFRNYLFGSQNVMLMSSGSIVARNALMLRGGSVEAETEKMAVGAAPDAVFELVETTALDTSAKVSGADAGAGADENAEADLPVYRDSEVPLAFFRPSLVTDEDGRLALRFTVPNANTTWGFRAIAYTDSLLSATFSRNIVAAKEIMVQPNLPRFLRDGDSAVIKASVMNATDEEQCVDTDIEIFDPKDGALLLAVSRRDTIQARGSVVADISLPSVPSDKPFIGYRIKSSTSLRADGEQSLIPVLPSVTPVIETYPFYMAPGRDEMSVKLPDFPEGSSVSLQFCENPVWYVVTALPGLLDKEASSATDAARSIFSASVADGLLRDNPEIAAALKEWSGSDRSSEMLTSMLERNDDLKVMLLNATPWMLDARDDTERMTRLSLLFDRGFVAKTVEANIALLEKLSCDCGGWSWCTRYPDASQWVTREVLGYMGRLARLGFLPDNGKLRGMIEDALAWDNAETLKGFRRYPKSDYTRYVHLHDMFAGLGIGAAHEQIVNATTQRILSGWKKASLAEKAMYAQVLFKHNYRTMSRTVLASVREYAESSAEKGVWFPSLDDGVWYGSMDKIGIASMILETFAMVEPDCDEIDGIRQWLILQKGSRNWGTSSAATGAVAAILTTSGRWIAPAEGSTTVKVGDEEIVPNATERLTGEFDVPITAHKASGKLLSVVKTADTSSWGAVYCRFAGDMEDMKSAGCQDMTIEKTMFVADSEQESSGIAYDRKYAHISDSLNVGDRVTVRLTFKVGQDMDYVVIVDDRPACFEPAEQLPSPIYAEGLCFYRENRDSSTRIFIDHLPKGIYQLSYDVFVNNAGRYVSGVAQAQSEYAPQYSAHSSGDVVSVKQAM